MSIQDYGDLTCREVLNCAPKVVKHVGLEGLGGIIPDHRGLEGKANVRDPSSFEKIDVRLSYECCKSLRIRIVRDPEPV